jgi:uridine kinase
MISNTPAAMSNPSVIEVVLPGGETRTCDPAITVGELLPGPVAGNGLPYLGALVNNDVCSLSFPLQVNSTVEFLTFADRYGSHIYRRSLAFLLAKAVRDLRPDCAFAVEHSIGNGYYCSCGACGKAIPGTTRITADQIAEIDAHMRSLIRRDIPLERRQIGFVEAYRMLEANRQFDKLNLLRYRNPPRIVLFSCEDFSDLGHEVLAPSTGVLEHFRLVPYPPGLVIRFPEWRDGQVRFTPYYKQRHLQKIFEEHKQWGGVIDIRSIADLNQAVAEQRIAPIIQMCEVQQDKKLSQIADQIAHAKPTPRFVLVAGPSSSGKTTFSKRLELHLRVNGLGAVRIEVDNYFHDRAQTPRDPSNKIDFEHIEAVDLVMLNAHLRALEEGKEVELPTFNFKQGVKEFRGQRLRLETGQVVILEGIHCLNPRLTEHVAEEHKFKVYVSALTQLMLDHNNLISTTDLRLLRRMVRDYRTRGKSALMTLRLWQGVRDGEQRWIFPYQKAVDAAFNSALAFEPAVLKTYVRPLLSEVKPFDREYADARRLLAFLELVNSTSAEHVPPTSLIREFIGGSVFE